jgi:hypothetical protein
MFSRQEKHDLARGIAGVLADRERLPADAPAVENPGKMPSIEGLKPAEADIVTARFVERQKEYVDHLLRRPGTLSASEQEFLGREIRRWSESGRPDE